MVRASLYAIKGAGRQGLGRGSTRRRRNESLKAIIFQSLFEVVSTSRGLVRIRSMKSAAEIRKRRSRADGDICPHVSNL
jgi:hypothetical protein